MGSVLYFYYEKTHFFASEVLHTKAVDVAARIWASSDGDLNGKSRRVSYDHHSYLPMIMDYPIENHYVVGVMEPDTHQLWSATRSGSQWIQTVMGKNRIVPVLLGKAKGSPWDTRSPQNLLLRFNWPKKRLMIARVEPIYRNNRLIGSIVLAYPFFAKQFYPVVRSLAVLFLIALITSLTAVIIFNRKLSKNIEQLYLSFEDASTDILQEPAPFIYEEFWQVVQWNRAVAGQLQESVQLQATLFQNSPCGIMILSDDGEVVETNSAAWSMLNHLDSSGMRWRVTDIAPEFSKAIEQVAAGKNHTGEVTLINGQEEMTVVFSAAPIQTEAWQGAVMFWLDQTEVKRLGFRLRQTERYQLVGELASIAAHELRNPLTTIVANAQLGQIVAEQPKAKELFLRIQQASHRMSEFLSEMMNMCRPAEAELVPLDLKAVLEDVLSLVKAQLLTQSIELHCRFDENLPRIWAEGKLLRQVFLNITQNAIQAMPTGGRLTVKAYVASNELVVSFQDTGGGIPVEIQGQLFKRFVTSKENGNGIGLFITRQIMVQTFDGRIWWSSHPGEGTEFFLAFPIIESISKNSMDSVEAYWRQQQTMVKYS